MLLTSSSAKFAIFILQCYNAATNVYFTHAECCFGIAAPFMHSQYFILCQLYCLQLASLMFGGSTERIDATKNDMSTEIMLKRARYMKRNHIFSVRSQILVDFEALRKQRCEGKR